MMNGTAWDLTVVTVLSTATTNELLQLTTTPAIVEGA
jgi:hypothetical protein